jgi:hypothetical protein
MRVRRLLVPLLVVWGIFAAASFQQCGMQEGVREIGLDDPKIDVQGDPARTSKYWGQLCSIWSDHLETIPDRATFFNDVQKIDTAEQGINAWKAMANSYTMQSKSATLCSDRVRSLDRKDVDGHVVDLGNRLDEYLQSKNAMLLESVAQCSDMSNLYVDVAREGDSLDWKSPKGNELLRKEEEIQKRMKHSALTSGQKDRQEVKSLVSRMSELKGPLEQRYGITLPSMTK